MPGGAPELILVDMTGAQPCCLASGSFGCFDSAARCEANCCIFWFCLALRVLTGILHCPRFELISIACVCVYVRARCVCVRFRRGINTSYQRFFSTYSSTCAVCRTTAHARQTVATRTEHKTVSVNICVVFHFLFH